jgi:glyoxylase-like metal-dependent hydrolase (beta-lactamase superfamily II)
LTHEVNGREQVPITAAPWIRAVPLRTPTLPPATHTNCYIVGERELCVIDPASPYPEEQQALNEIVQLHINQGRTLQLILLTHHHIDHVSGAQALAAQWNVPIAAHAVTAARLAGRVNVTRTIDESESLPFAPRGLIARFTPGHAPGHLCFHDEAAAALIVGDMVASVGTIIVEPEDGGDMTLYLESLRRLRRLVDEGARWLLPAHGPAIGDAAGKLDFYVAHRLQREGLVAAALSDEPRSVAELVPPAYPDVPPAIHGLAARSLLAHLIKLEREGRALRDGERWRRPR